MGMKLKLKSSLKQKLALKVVEKQLQILKLKEALVLVGFTIGAAVLRIPMQAIPSAEPLTFFAILAGWLFGRYKGLAVGATSLYISNFFMFGGQGPWSIFQAAGFAAAGFLGGFLRKKASYVEVIGFTLLGTVIFELIMNSTSFVFLGGNFLMAFVLALPFTGIHLVSNLIFSFFLPKAKEFVEKKGEFNEREICENLLKKHKS